jgi:hypothetical protein
MPMDFNLVLDCLLAEHDLKTFHLRRDLNALRMQSFDAFEGFLQRHVGPRVVERAAHAGAYGCQASGLLEALTLPYADGIAHGFTG